MENSNADMNSLPKLALTLAQQWAAQGGKQKLATLLAEERVGDLVDEIFEQVVARFSPQGAPVSEADYTEMNAEEEAGSLEGWFLAIHAAFAPLASALGCCPDCFVGMEGCPTCGGEGSIGGFQKPNPRLLKSLIIQPLQAVGVPLKLESLQRQAPIEPQEFHSGPPTGHSLNPLEPNEEVNHEI